MIQDYIFANEEKKKWIEFSMCCKLRKWIATSNRNLFDYLTINYERNQLTFIIRRTTNTTAVFFSFPMVVPLLLWEANELPSVTWICRSCNVVDEQIMDIYVCRNKSMNESLLKGERNSSQNVKAFHFFSSQSLFMSSNI